ncbi:outer membrane protein assembly factor BamE [Aquincola sp. J276]|uniref:outer membrane protein assembly factor BamE n=1 Tax=Aquincola sp. J276 TaxID=2898432 RepID=UPI002151A654|nr:outer membrane protein assembly factor BamE [Aquincola sp. J276]MCR5865425.1 outer membrane protein assembly factor BamE [Aquincola sp. J276]
MDNWTIKAVFAAAAVVAGLLAGCDAERIAKLEEGVATEADVRKQFGEPAAVFDEPDGSRTFDYPRQPEGAVNYMITIGPDGRMTALRQVLTARNLERVQPGMSADEVRRLLGRPAKQQTYALKQQTEWDWRWQDGGQAKAFTVVFDAGMKVLRTGIGDDPRITSPG